MRHKLWFVGPAGQVLHLVYRWRDCWKNRRFFYVCSIMDRVPVGLVDIAVDSWTVGDVEKWLERQNFAPAVRELFKTHEIDGFCLLRINEHDLHEAPLCITKLGIIKRLAGAIHDLKSTTIAKVDISRPGLPVKEEANGSNGNGDVPVVNGYASFARSGVSSSSSETEEADTKRVDSPPVTLKYPPQHRRLPPLKPEIGRAVIAFGWGVDCLIE